ncbi:acetoacetate decarboxylase family protein [Streptomyces sp. NPDC059479]|uniref:acetoacetate decarboxylase family protein n=1 Tax=Streptomyces sp. NPDC059479 TaxID=3346848 RepID=UPI0036AAF9B7
MLSGTADPEIMAADAPFVTAPATEPLVCRGAEVLQAVYEVRGDARQAVLPPALHPVNPPAITVTVVKAEESDVGPFTLAETRIICRSGPRSRGMHVSCFVQGDEAARLLAERWAYRVRPAEVELRRRYHGSTAVVRYGQLRPLALDLLDPRPLSPADLRFTDALQLARTPAGIRFLQVERVYEIHEAGRGRPSLTAFDAAAWGEPRLHPSHPISALWATADMTIRPVRYLCRADIGALEGTERIGQ